MRPRRACTVLLALALAGCLGHPPVQATLPRPFKLYFTNLRLRGRVVDHTANHGPDRRIWSPSLRLYRDVYVYLPPGYSPCKRYPLAIFLHGVFSDERSFIRDAVGDIDRAIVDGELPPTIFVVPDGQTAACISLLSKPTFFANSLLGDFENYVVRDIYDFAVRNYPIRPEREAHALVGASMGGLTAFNAAMRYPEKFGMSVAMLSPLNTRYLSCRGNYREPFDPSCPGPLRENYSNSRELIARIFGVPIRLGRLVHPLYGKDNPDTAALVAASNPIELLDAYDIQPGQIEMFVAYAGRDEFNLNAQAESFLFRARMRGLSVGTAYLPDGKHRISSGRAMLPAIFRWMKPRLAPYAPG